MKYWIGLLLSLFCTELTAQLQAPESIIWNDFTQSYIISDAGAGKLISMDRQGKTSDFTTGLNQPKGITLGTLSLWVTDINKIVEIDPGNGEILGSYPISGSLFLNDIVSDGLFYLYISDSQSNKIFRFDEENKTSEIFSKGNIIAPNGLYYDTFGGLIIVSLAQKANIYTMDTEEGNVEVLMQTNINNLDGIAYDMKRRRFYISSFSQNTIYTVDDAFSESAQVLMSGFNGPADIYFDETIDSLVVPNMNSAKIDFIGFGTTGVNDDDFVNSFELKNMKINIFPNPTIGVIKINFDLNNSSFLKINIMDITGRIVKNEINEIFEQGFQEIVFDLSGLKSGIYFINFELNNTKIIKKLIIH